MNNKSQIEKDKYLIGVYRSKVRKKLIFILLITMSLLLIIQGFIYYEQAVNNAEKELLKSAEQYINKVNDDINNFLYAKEHNLIFISDYLSRLEQKDDTQYLEGFLQSVTKNDQSIKKINYILKNNLEQTNWYNAALENVNEVVWTKPDKESSGEIVIKAAKAVVQDGQTMGVVSIEIILNNLLEKAVVNIDDTGYLTFLNENNIVIAHPDKKMIGQNYNNEYEEKEEHIITGTNKITGWRIIGIINKDEISKNVNSIFSLNIIIIGIGLFLSILFAIIIANWITKPLLIKVKL